MATASEIAKALERVAKALCGVCRAKDHFCTACPFARPASLVLFLTAEPRTVWLGEGVPEALQGMIERERVPEKHGTALMEDIFRSLLALEIRKMMAAGRPRGEVKALLTAAIVFGISENLYRLKNDARQERRKRQSAEARRRLFDTKGGKDERIFS